MVQSACFKIKRNRRTKRLIIKVFAIEKFYEIYKPEKYLLVIRRNVHFVRAERFTGAVKQIDSRSNF